MDKLLNKKAILLVLLTICTIVAIVVAYKADFKASTDKNNEIVSEEDDSITVIDRIDMQTDMDIGDEESSEDEESLEDEEDDDINESDDVEDNVGSSKTDKTETSTDKTKEEGSKNNTTVTDDTNDNNTYKYAKDETLLREEPKKMGKVLVVVV